MGIRSLGLSAMLAVFVALLAASGAHATGFNVTFCDDSAAAPWSVGFAAAVDGCTDGSGYQFLTNGDDQPADSSDGATVVIPSGEVLTHVTASFSSVAPSTGLADLYIGYGTTAAPGEANVLYGPMGNANVGTSVNADVPQANDLYVSVFCSPQTSCDYGTQNIVTLGAMTFTLQDTAPPTVSAQGGTLTGHGIRRGMQTLGYAAASGGSGVATVALMLGSHLVAQSNSTCTPGQLRPCPPSVTGVFSVDTQTLPDGTYPIVLTAYDESGDPTSVTLGTAQVSNHSATQILLTRGPGRVHTKIEIGWNWSSPRHTVLKAFVVRRLARTGTVSLSCAGRRCPFRHRSTDRRALGRFERRLRGRTFVAGDRLTVEVQAPHRRPERARLLIRSGREPRVLRRGSR